MPLPTPPTEWQLIRIRQGTVIETEFHIRQQVCGVTRKIEDR